MELEKFNIEYLNPFMEIIDKEDKRKFLLGDFNVDLLKIDEDAKSSNFFDTLTTNLFVPHIIHPTRITPTSKTLIDNIFSNSTNYNEGISGNLTVKLSDHLAQFLIIPEDCHRSTKKLDFYTRDLKNFDRENFFHDIMEINWRDTLNYNNNNPNESLEVLLEKTNGIINKYLPKRKMTKNEIKGKLKPWITNDTIKLMKKRDSLYKHYLKAKDELVKDLFHKKYKTLRNQIVTLQTK